MLLSINKYWVQKLWFCFLLKIVGGLISQIQLKNEIVELKTIGSGIYPLSLFLKKHSTCLYKLLVDISVYDYPGKLFRFSVFYILLSSSYNTRMLVNTKLLESWPVLVSLIPLYSCAAWVEREVFDFFGIFFFNNYDLRRILTDYGFVGYPLRKDFPLTGSIEILYDDSQKQIIYKPIELIQDFRGFSFQNTWNNV